MVWAGFHNIFRAFFMCYFVNKKNGILLMSPACQESSVL